jgi:hypothetical protein
MLSGARFDFDPLKSERLRTNPKRAIGFQEALEIYSHPYYQDQRYVAAAVRPTARVREARSR